MTRPVPVTSAKTTPTKQTQAKAVSLFAPALKSALHTSPAIVSQKPATGVRIASPIDTYLPPKPFQASLVTARFVPTISTSITLTPGLPPVTTSGAPASTVTGTTPATSAVTDAVSQPSVIDTLKAALAAAGVDTTGMQFTEHQDLVTYPGGSYVNDMISLQTANGKSHDYMTNLVAIAPQVAANEIQQLMAGNRG